MAEQDNLSPNPEDNLSPNEEVVKDDPSLVANDPINADPNKVVDPDPKPDSHWYDSLQSEDLKSHPKIQEFKDADGLAKSYLELQSVLGNEKIAVPKDENDKVAIDLLNKAIGIPEDVAGYKMEAPKPPEGLEHMAFGLDEFKEMALKHKLTPTQAEGLMNEYVGLLGNLKVNAEKQYMDGLDATKNELKAEWGLAYDANVKLAQSVMNKFTSNKEEFDHVNAMIGADPVSLKWLANIGKNFSEGSLGNIGDQGTRFTKTPSEAKTEYEAIMSDPNDIYWAGVRNQNPVSESVRKERIGYVESLLRMSQPVKTS